MDPEDKMIQDLNEKNQGNISLPIVVSILLVVVALGVSLGYVLSSSTGGISLGGKTKSIGENKKDSAGVLDKKQFPDDAEGTLKEGGIDGEGNYHLVRPGGESQNVYLTSSIVDLSQFVGKKVRVWGQTFAGEKAGWLMDVGYVEVL